MGPYTHCAWGSSSAAGQEDLPRRACSPPGLITDRFHKQTKPGVSRRWACFPGESGSGGRLLWQQEEEEVHGSSPTGVDRNGLKGDTEKGRVPSHRQGATRDTVSAISR